MKKIILSVLVFILAACSMGGSEFSQNQKKWQNANISHYRFELNVGCFCAFRNNMPLTIEVQNGQVTSMSYADGTQVNESERTIFDAYSTLDSLFDYTAARMKDAAEVKVTYDSTYGYPNEVSIDNNKEIADDELYLSVSGFEKLP
jgi:Family of unknown function (DUF6174)